ncbi:MAG: hypothetical protein IJ191_00575 [Treponema sp.]|nr:hypothetical protein [Treponema sp.]
MGFSDTVSSIIDTSIAVSKKVVTQAGDAVQKLSDWSVIRLEKHQHEMRREALIISLGEAVAHAFITAEKSDVSATDESIAQLIDGIRTCDAEIARREAVLAAEQADKDSAAPADEKPADSGGA